jgi:hypothetical protein
LLLASATCQRLTSLLYHLQAFSAATSVAAPLFRRTSSALSDQPALAHKPAVALGSQERKAAPGWAAVVAGGGTCTKGRVDLHLAWKRGKPSTLFRDLAASHAASDAPYV